jgi:hypothetical protein
LNRASLEGIGAARHASPLFDAETGVATGGGAGAGPMGCDGATGFVGAGVGFAGDAAGGVDVVNEATEPVVVSLEELPAPQPLSAENKNIRVSRPNTLIAFELFPIPPVPILMIDTEHERRWCEFT